MLTKEEYMEIKEALLEELKTAVPERAEAIYIVLSELEENEKTLTEAYNERNVVYEIM